MHEMRAFAQQSFTLAKRFANQTQLAVLKVAQSPVDDARGTAGDSGSEIILLDQQSCLARAGALPRHRHAMNAPADHHHVKVAAFERRLHLQG